MVDGAAKEAPLAICCSLGKSKRAENRVNGFASIRQTWSLASPDRHADGSEDSLPGKQGSELARAKH